MFRHSTLASGGVSRAWLAVVFVLLIGTAAPGQAPRHAIPSTATPPASRADALDSATQRERDAAVEQALRWMASRQHGDGSFEAPALGQPAVTALCVLAFLSAGHMPGNGPYGEQLNAAIDYMLAAQKGSGVISLVLPAAGEGHGQPSIVGMYNHGITAMVLAECYGMTDGDRAIRIGRAIEDAIAFSRERQLLRKRKTSDEGGWRYLRPDGNDDADLSVTSWQLKFYRAAQNAGFEIPHAWIAEALAYTARCFDPAHGAFTYHALGGPGPTRAMAGAGILAFSLGGQHGTDMAHQSGQWLSRQRFDRYNQSTHPSDQYHYSAFYAAYAAHQLGGDCWQRVYPGLARTLIANQAADGSWPAERGASGFYGNTYSSALATLALTAPYELLPLFQR